MMPAAAIPPHEAQRLAALRAYGMLDGACDSVLDDVVQLAARLTSMPMALVTLIDSDRQVLLARKGVDMSETPRDVSFCAHAILTPDQPMIVSDMSRDPRAADNPYVTGPPHLRAYLGIPLVNSEGYALGALCVLDEVVREHDANMVATMQSLARTVVTTLELRRVMRQVHNLALTDALTGLANRPALMDALGRAIGPGAGFSVLCLDLDGFKGLNDSQGHAVGDLALTEVAQELRLACGTGDVAARLGGDEFALLLASGEAEPMAERVRTGIARRMAAQGWAVTASIGGVTFHAPPEDAASALAMADALLYEAKRGGRNRAVLRVSEQAPLG
ncbi:sensor domain-containing diguanylate cyclase [Roseococcus microcysteis]|uniref:sensor domain-containing diguanylate cyclase n=1 Tax=Roseococcus microcysteis TaxID=2771361 RepID=UPI00168AA2A0|nr:sensor domain-containing diguanylate cyclase [Roseococcus microcysteis]